MARSKRLPESECVALAEPAYQTVVIGGVLSTGMRDLTEREIADLKEELIAVLFQNGISKDSLEVFGTNQKPGCARAVIYASFAEDIDAGEIRESVRGARDHLCQYGQVDAARITIPPRAEWVREDID